MGVVDVQVYLNLSANFNRGYEPGDEMQKVHSIEGYLNGENMQAATECCDRIFTRLNSDKSTGYRSLSVGDVLIIGEVAYTCEWNGWRYVQMSMSA